MINVANRSSMLMINSNVIKEKVPAQRNSYYAGIWSSFGPSPPADVKHDKTDSDRNRRHGDERVICTTSSRTELRCDCTRNVRNLSKHAKHSLPFVKS